MPTEANIVASEFFEEAFAGLATDESAATSNNIAERYHYLKSLFTIKQRK